MKLRPRRRAAKTVELSHLGWIAASISVAVILFGLLGPFFVPHPTNEILAAPYLTPSSEYPLGTDFAGRDALSRFMAGGRSAISIAFAATLIGSFVGVSLGLLAAYKRGVPDFLFSRGTEVLMAFPSLILVLLLVAGGGTSVLLLILALALAISPSIGRLARSAALVVRTQAYVDVAIARGEHSSYVVAREILPNILAVLAVDFGVRFAGSIIFISSASFLGVGLEPPTADWGLMISENSPGLTIQPWVTIAPVVAIGLLLIGISITFDQLRRRVVAADPLVDDDSLLLAEEAPAREGGVLAR